MNQPTSKAAFLTAIGAPFEVRAAPYPSPPQQDQLLIKAHAVAINPVDLVVQNLGPQIFNRTLPMIQGYDVAGEVIAVGPDVTRFQPGDRVAGYADAGAFQEYVPLAEHMTIPLPAQLHDNLAQAAVLPMAVAVATKTLFHPDLLALDLPVLEANKKQQHDDEGGKTVLIWGGATSVGSMTIQMAVAAGYDVISTASPHNFSFVRSLGASVVLDYASPSIHDDMLAAFATKVCIGAVANGTNDPARAAAVARTCAAVVRQFGQQQQKKPFVACTMLPPTNTADEEEGDVEYRFVANLRGDRELAATVLHGFVPGALARGSLRALPVAEVVGTGLESVQVGMDALRRGVSASKIVVTM